MKQHFRIGFVASRLAGTDGVSLEAQKWRDVLQRMGCECFCFCSRTEWPEDKAYLSPEASLSHQDIWEINRSLFERKQRTPSTGKQVTSLKEHLKQQLRDFVKTFDLNMLVAENCLSLPMNIPLGLALVDYIAETDIPTLGHHHDFWWERDRYTGSPAEDILRGAFPAALPPVRHVVINSVAARELAYRTGERSVLIPNVMDFASQPATTDGYAADMRESIGLRKHERLILQPTRIVPRKRIEKAIELVRRIQSEGVLLVTHDAGDEGHAYVRYLRELADLMDVRLLMPAERFDGTRGRTREGDKVYSLKDAYQRADLVSYCSAIEGFGNAFLETIYYRRPLLMSAYEIFSLDIRPKGFQVMSFQDFISDRLVARVQELLDNSDKTREWTDNNYELGRKYYSYEALEQKLNHVVKACSERC